MSLLSIGIADQFVREERADHKGRNASVRVRRSTARSAIRWSARTWGFLDMMVALASFVTAHFLSPRFSFATPHHYGILRGGVLFAATVLALGYVFGVYDRHNFMSLRKMATQALLVNGVAMGVTSVIFAWIGFYQIGRFVVFETILLSGVSTFLCRLMARELAVRAKVRVMLVGPKAKVRLLAAQFRRLHCRFYDRPIYFEPMATDVHDRRAELLQAFQEHQPDEIVVMDNDVRLLDLLHHSAPILLSGCGIFSYSRYYEKLMGEVPVDSIDERAILGEGFNVGSLHTGLLKRPFDIAMAVFGLVVGSPLMLLCAMLVHFTSPGPIIYKQVRVGRYGRKFYIYKFRTMCHNAERNGAQWAKAGDVRVTAVGKFLRKTRFDELPQLWNILWGDMSLVGPRPERPEFVEKLRQQIPHYDLRHLVLPGLTGWAQVKFRYGATIADAQRKLALDLYYVRHCGTAFDLSVCLRTLAAMAKGAR